MNLKYFWIFLFCSLLSVFSGCRNDDDLGGNGKLTISSVSVRSNENTRSSSTALTSGSIGVYLSGTNGYSTQSKIYRYDCSGGTWVANPTDIYLYGNKATLCAFYPYNSSITDPTIINMTSQLYTSDNDLVYSPFISTPSNQAPNVTFNMGHAYSKLTFIIQNIALPTPCKIDQIQISNAGLLSTGTIDITTGSYTEGMKSGIIFGNLDIVIPKGSSATASFLVVPPSEKLSGDITVKCTVDGQEKTAKFDVASYNLTTIAPGQDYQIYLSLGYSLVESNCYMVKPNNIVYIPISRANTAWVAAGMSAQINDTNWTSGLEWTDNSNGMSSYGAVQSITSNQQGGYIAVRTGSTTGNAVVYLKNSLGNIVWSWHIWVTDYDPNNGTTYSYSNGTDSYTFMDRNLGATSTLGAPSVDPASQNSRGLIYQWGRKDPFPGANNISGTTTDRSIYSAAGNGILFHKEDCNSSTNLTNSINNPMWFYFSASGLCDWYTNASAANHQDNLWGGASTAAPDAKTVFDPCPVGWRVPAWDKSASPWAGITLGNTTWNYGYTFNAPAIGYYPAAGDRDFATGNLLNVGLTGEYWSASVDGNNAHYWYMDSSGSINSSASKPRATGMNVRCVKE